MYQQGQWGYCWNCPAGKIANADHSVCDFCPDGQVRGSAEGTILGPCVSAVVICDSHLQGKWGICSLCPDGQVANGNQSGCEFCPDGQVRGNADGTDPGPCVPASTICDAHEKGQYGICETCPDGEVASGDYSVCEPCPTGQVRGNADGSASGYCISAIDICAANERAFDGRCLLCSNGMVANADHTACVNTPEPTAIPTSKPTLEQTDSATQEPTLKPTKAPTLLPTPGPTQEPTLHPNAQITTTPPTPLPTPLPTKGICQVCHNGNTLTIGCNAAASHLLNHAGDTDSPCPDSSNDDD